MFGYVRAREDMLPQADRERYEAAYCGLCLTMKKQYGAISRLFLNYDFVFLAMLLDSEETVRPTECVKCPLHPVRGKTACKGGGWMETAAGESVVLTWWKLRDAVADGGFLTRLSARFLGLFLRPGYRQARGGCLEFDVQTARLLAELRELERHKSPSIDQTADCFARILQAAAPTVGEMGLDRSRQQLLYHLGRWIYLIDAVDDLTEDKKTGNYNPVAARFPEWSQEDRDYLRHNMDHSLALVGAAFQLLPVTIWSSVLENIIYSGLPTVEELVFSGKWREYQKKRRRNKG